MLRYVKLINIDLRDTLKIFAMKSSKTLIEWIATAIILIVFLSLQWNAISKGNYAGQDYWRHYRIVEISAQNPWQALTTPCGLGTPSDLYHFVGGVLYNTIGESRTFVGMAIINCVVNIVALFLYYLLIRKVIVSLILRLSCLLFITFLPLTVISSVVIASDAFTAPLFIAIVLGGILITEKLHQGKKCLGWLSLEGLLLILIYATKFNYALCVVGIFLVGIILQRCRLLKKSKMGMAFLILVLVPTLLLVICYFAFIRCQFSTFLHCPKKTTSMSIQDFLLKKNDLSLLEAPYFHSTKVENGHTIRLFEQKSYYSYPSLLHLSIFTDFLNIYQPIRLSSNAPGVEDEYDTRIRPPKNQDRMRFAVRSGILFSLTLFLVLIWLILKFAHLIWHRNLKLDDCYIVIPLTLSFVVYIGTIATFPSLYSKWGEGIWLPRYILPVIISFGIFVFIGFEKIFHKMAWAQWAILLTTLLQTILHISFLWIVL